MAIGIIVLTTFVICIDFHTKEQKKSDTSKTHCHGKTQIDVLKTLRFIGLENGFEGLTNLPQQINEKEPKRLHFVLN